jgi:septum formation protein
VSCELLLPGNDEDSEALEVVLAGESPTAYVQRVTQLKLDAALARLKRRDLPPAPILCSDTTVAKGSRIYGKPDDAADAQRMLAELAGSTHRVLTAVAVQHGRKRLQALSVSRVSFAPMSRAQIRAYVASGEPMGKAGAYAVQGRVAMFISHISGSYSGIMGLPLHETAGLLRAAGLKI